MIFLVWKSQKLNSFVVLLLRDARLVTGVRGIGLLMLTWLLPTTLTLLAPFAEMTDVAAAGFVRGTSWSPLESCD